MSKRRTPKIPENPKPITIFLDPDVHATVQNQRKFDGLSIKWQVNTAIRFWNEHKDKVPQAKAA